MEIIRARFRIGDRKTPAMLQRRYGLARRLDQRRVDFRHEDAWLDAALGQYLAPGRDDQRMTEGLALVLVQASLGCREYEAAVFDGAGAQQRMPMGLAGFSRKGGRHREERSAAFGKRAI